MHPLGDILAEWASLARTRSSRPRRFVELRRMSSERGDLVFLFNHGTGPASVTLDLPLRAAFARGRELITGEAVPPTPGAALRLATTIPGESVRVYRLDR